MNQLSLKVLGLFMIAGLFGSGCAFYGTTYDTIEEVPPPSLIIQGSVTSVEGKPIPGALIYVESSSHFSNLSIGSIPQAFCEFGSGATGSIGCSGDVELPSGACAATCPCPDGHYILDLQNCADSRGEVDENLVICYQGVCDLLNIQCGHGECFPESTSFIRPTTMALDTYNTGIDRVTAAICDQVSYCEPNVSFDTCMISIENTPLGEELGFHPLVLPYLDNVTWNLRYRVLDGSLKIDETLLDWCLDDIYQSSCEQFDLGIVGPTLNNLEEAIPFTGACQNLIY